jgi:predicted ATP-dependent endonuclease of OLD family
MGENTQLSQFPTSLKPNDEAALVEALRNPRRRELVFARALGLVEGDTERAYFEAIAPRAGFNLDALGISIVSVKGDSRYKPYLAYLTALGIPVKCLRDKPPTGIGE